MNKSYIILQMYDALRLGACIKIRDCCGVYGISVSTFRRYMAFLRAYFSEMYGLDIVYDAYLSSYSLTADGSVREKLAT